MNDTSIEFKLSDAEEIKALAIYVAQLTKEGVTFKMLKDSIGIQVTLTGGF
jgi:hypothetical protein